MSISVDIRHDFGGFSLHLAFEAPPGVTALFGRSGSGKTSVINTVAGLLRPNAGRVVVNGHVLLDTDARIFLPTHKRRVGYVFQEARLFPHLSVRQNLSYGQRFAPKTATRADWNHVIEMLGIGGLLERQPVALSGGEKQRVAIGRALLSVPDTLLLDEPLAALDAARKAEILPYLHRLRDETRIPILYVSHSASEVARIANFVVLLENGRLRQQGSAAEVLSDPDAVPALGVRDAGAMIRGRILRHHDDGLSEISFSGGTLLLPRQPDAAGSDVRVWILARDVMLSLAPVSGISALNTVSATIHSIRSGEGPGVMVQLEAGDDLILARITKRSAAAMNLRVGMRCYGIMKSVAVAKEDIG